MESATVPPEVYTTEIVDAANDLANSGWDTVDP